MNFRRSIQLQRRTTDLVPLAASLVAGSAIALNHFAELPARSYSRQQLLASLLISALAAAAGFLISHRLILRFCTLCLAKTPPSEND